MHTTLSYFLKQIIEINFSWLCTKKKAKPCWTTNSLPYNISLDFGTNLVKGEIDIWLYIMQILESKILF